MRAVTLPLVVIAMTAAWAVAAQEPDVAGSGGLDASPMEEGADLFASNCAACHGGSGEGVEGPPLARNARVQSVERVARQIIHGSTYMPAFGDQLDDHQIAAIAAFVRNSWGNAYGAVTEADVAAFR